MTIELFGIFASKPLLRVAGTVVLSEVAMVRTEYVLDLQWQEYITDAKRILGRIDCTQP